MPALAIMNAMNYATANATGFVTLARGALSAAQGAVADAGFGEVVYVPASLPGAPSTPALPSAPAIDPVRMDLPMSPASPADALELPSLDLGHAPTFTALAPSTEFPTQPTQLGAAPGAPQIVTNFVFPDPPAALSTALPPAPTLPFRTEPATPEILLPSFDQRTPEHLGGAPTDGAEVMNQTYSMQSLLSQQNTDAYVDAWIEKHSPGHHEQMARLEARLTEAMQGGTGINPQVEDAIYARAQERNDVEAARVRDAAYGEAASRGFTLPTGALMAAIARARQDAANNNLKASSDIVVMKAEMEQKNFQFAISTSAQLRSTLLSAAQSYMGHVVSINGQAMDYAKSVFSNVVEIYNASVRAFSARVEAYRGYAAVYESQVRAASLKLDVYRGEIAALQAMTDVDQTRIEAYKTQIDAVASMIKLYQAQIDAVQGRASLEKLKLEVFQVQTQSFGAQVQAKNAEWGGYTARLGGEEAKMRMYGAQVGAYAAQVGAYKAVVDAKLSNIAAVSATNQANASMYNASVQSFVSQVSAETSKANAQNENNRSVINAFDREITGFMAQTNLALARYKAEAEVSLQNATGDLSAQTESARAKSQYGATLAQISNDGAKIYGQLAGSAMAGINTLVAATAEL